MSAVDVPYKFEMINLSAINPMSIVILLEVNSDVCVLRGKKAKSQEYLEERCVLEGAARSENGKIQLPLSFFSDVMKAYVKKTNSDKALIERSGHIVCTDLILHDICYVDACAVISEFGVEYAFSEDGMRLEIALDPTVAGPRSLTPQEEELPYSKYYNDYWKTPFHLRADTKAWEKKSKYYLLSSMRRPDEMLHLNEARKLLNKDYLKNQWKEGWTLFEDGSGVMCVKTEFPGVSSEMFEWWFEWHPQEDIRYMLWYPPSHYGISTSIELRQMLSDDSKTTYDKTHGGTTVHLVYESTSIDSFSYSAAKSVKPNPIVFHDPQERTFLEEDVEFMKKNKIVAICGGTRMLHYFVEDENSLDGCLYTHFWFGLKKDEDKGWIGNKNEKDYSIVQPILNIAQHATKEFANLAQILPQIYKEEAGSK